MAVIKAYAQVILRVQWDIVAFYQILHPVVAVDLLTVMRVAELFLVVRHKEDGEEVVIRRAVPILISVLKIQRALIHPTVNILVAQLVLLPHQVISLANHVKMLGPIPDVAPVHPIRSVLPRQSWCQSLQAIFQ